jgi:hypothetical protein
VQALTEAACCGGGGGGGGDCVLCCSAWVSLDADNLVCIILLIVDVIDQSWSMFLAVLLHRCTVACDEYMYQ